MSSKSIIVLGIIATFSILFVVALSMGYGSNNYLFQDGSKPLSGNLNMSHNYVLEMDYTHLMHFTMGVGVTDFTVNVVPSEFWIQDKHFHKIGFSVDNAPGVGKSCSCSITDGTNTITVTLSEGEISGSSSTGAFDLDVSAETFTINYSQDAGGSSTKGMMVMLYHYKENE